MQIRNSTSGMNALRNLKRKQGSLSKALEKLSSGYQINRSADDAAGLAISEKMRLIITGLGRAYKNSQEGTDLVQTGEGALDEIHAMLNRALELADSSANGTYDDTLDRANLQKELDQICAEIDRIAKNTAFNTIKLFQDDGYEYETFAQYEALLQQIEQSAAAARQTAEQADTAGTLTLDDLLAGQETGGLNIVYIENITDGLETTQTPSGTATAPSGIVIDGKDLSDILKTEIIPNTVQNILRNYPAFSYLTGSSIGIGLEYFSSGSSGGSTTLAYVSGSASTAGYITYTLGVNTSVLAGVTSRDGLADLEATIAHEMIHAFMDEATTAGMFGRVTTASGSTTTAAKFPDWFKEGMAQTASGPGNWLVSSGGLNISAASTHAQIAAAIAADKLGSSSTASQYGTGYLACMYMGAVIAGSGSVPSSIDAETISLGMTKLLNEMIGGQSLDQALNTLTKGKFTSCADFVTQFNACSTEVSGFVQALLAATGSGRGGIVSGDLTATDLTADTDLGDSVKLFLLDTGHSEIRNIYPAGYPVFSGGATSTSGTAPSDFTPADLTPKEYGDLLISGALASEIVYNDATGEVTITAAGDVKISMKTAGSTSSLNKITLNSTGTVTLDGVSLSDPNALTVQQDTKITYTGVNSFGGATLESGVNAALTGTGQINFGMFDSDSTNTVSLNGGAVIVGGGTGQINAGTVNVNNAAVAAALASGATALEPAAVPWSLLGLTGDITNMTIDGSSTPMLLDNGQTGASLWLDPASNHRVTFTDAAGASKTLAAIYNTTTGQFQWQAAIMPFQVSGGIQGIDWDYAGDGRTLLILSSAALTISGGTVKDENGQDLLGRIQVADNTGSVSLTLDGVDCNTTSMKECAFDLGAGNTVSLTLTDGTDNKFQSGQYYAGISVGEGTHLTINGTDNGSLETVGGYESAGIGSSYADNLTDPTNSITINGGSITASGGYGGAGIGAGRVSSFGDITINGGTISAHGGTGGAGIGGAYGSKVGDIVITDGDITAQSAAHGAGIGGGWGGSATNGTITISGGTITASSTEHGTGIGAGCSGKSGIVTISGGTINATGGNSGAGIGASWTGSCDGVVITGGSDLSVTAQGGNSGAGIGAGGTTSRVGGILIDTAGTVSATGGTNGVGIGSGYGGSSCGNIVIQQGTVEAVGSTDSTGIGAGHNSTSGSITIGDVNNPASKVVVDAIGGMTNNGGNIISYSDAGHTNEGTVTIVGDNTTVRPGTAGEGLYSTSGVTDGAGNSIYAYPVYLFEADPALEAGEGLTGLPLPDGAKNIQISATGADGTTQTWTPGLSHEPLSENYVFVWMTGQDQKLTISYDDADGNHKTTTLDLKFYENAGVFRTGTQTVPSPAVKPGYSTDPVPDTPTPTPSLPGLSQPGGLVAGGGGIILQIGANYGEILEVPRFYLSLKALGMEDLDISTQEHAWASIPILQAAINRVSSIRGNYGALANRLEHNQQDLSQSKLNLTDAESRIRDADMAEEQMHYILLSIQSQSAQAMVAQANQNASQVLQLLQ